MPPSIRPLRSFALGLVLLALLQSGVAGATRTESGNSYYTGSDLVIVDAVPGDLFAAGGRVRLDQDVGEDAALAGGNVEVRADVGKDLRAAGGDVFLDSKVGGELIAFGGTVRVTDGASVSGSTLVAGGEIAINGALLDGAKIYANRIVFNGEIDGDARLYAPEIVFGSNARIDGNLSYASQTPLPEEQVAKVTGRVTREKTPESWNKQPAGNRGMSWFHPFFFLSMLLSGFVLWLLFPNAIEGVRIHIARAPLRSILLGLGLFFLLPPFALLLMLTIIGIPIGLGLFTLYPLLLMLGYLAAAFFIARKLADAMHRTPPFGKAKQAAFLAGALLLLTIAAAIPVIGWLFVFVALAAGLGGWMLWAADARRKSAGGAAAATTSATDSDVPV